LDLTYESVEAMLAELSPREPVYCIYPAAYGRAARRFLQGFPGRVLYAVKANDHPDVIRLLHAAGVGSFDCASVPEIALIRRHCPEATPYFMTPARLRGAAVEALEVHGVRHFLIDDQSGLRALAGEIGLESCVVFARMSVRHDSAMMDFSSKFGAPPDAIPGLLEQIAESGAEPALAFNVGSSVTSPDAYLQGLETAAERLGQLPLRVRLLDLGGGFPLSYPGFEVPPLERYFESIAGLRDQLPLADDGELMAEPGRALAAPGLSAVTQVMLRKDDRLYLNDGMFGIFWELRFKGHKRYPCRVFRGTSEHAGDAAPFRLFGPTCDGSDVMPEPFELPADIQPGDYIEFGAIGAYSLAGRTRFNGFFSDTIVHIDGEPPGTAQGAGSASTSHSGGASSSARIV
jgi:ornithine decarboxylase